MTEEEWRASQEVKAGITGAKGESAVARELARLGHPALHDVILSDSRGLTQIDHLALAPDAIVLLETKRYSGFITGNCTAGHGRSICLAERRRRRFRTRFVKITDTAARFRKYWPGWLFQSGATLCRPDTRNSAMTWSVSSCQWTACPRCS